MTPWAVVLLALLVASAQSQADPRDAAISIVIRIQRADYEGDRAALQRLYEELTPLGDDTHLVSRVRYWRGFALWRRAINGFNETVTPDDLGRDLEQAVREFDEALSRDPTFVDAKVGTISCLSLIGFLQRNEAGRVSELWPRVKRLTHESVDMAPENPRLLWVIGQNQWVAPRGTTPSEVDDRQTTALATYERGLQLARRQKDRVTDRLEPSWGEPELLMNLAWSSLNRRVPDVRAAENYATQALALVPYWHYTRDILMPQIRSAKAKQ
jgi:tetratricopeptide (TPR) repeat protein